jgi:hypothetical protein
MLDDGDPDTRTEDALVGVQRAGGEGDQVGRDPLDESRQRDDRGSEGEQRHGAAGQDRDDEKLSSRQAGRIWDVPRRESDV